MMQENVMVEEVLIPNKELVIMNASSRADEALKRISRKAKIGYLFVKTKTMMLLGSRRTPQNQRKNI